MLFKNIMIIAVTAVFHNPYNSPLGIYSDSNVLEEFQNQTKGLLMPEINNNNTNTNKYQPPPTPPPINNNNYNSSTPLNHQPLLTTTASASSNQPSSPQFYQQQQQQQPPNYLQQIQQQGQGNKLPRGCNSLSMHMLGKGIQSAVSANRKLFYF